MSKIKLAQGFAVEAHNQQKYGEKPYLYHLKHVYQVLCRFGYHKDEDLLCAAYLHDVLEDTKVEYNQIVSMFGDAIGELVERVTDCPGENREERKAATYPKIAGNYRAVILKMADRIANYEATLAECKPIYISLYVQEWPKFAQSLPLADANPDMARYLTQLNVVAGNYVFTTKEYLDVGSELRT